MAIRNKNGHAVTSVLPDNSAHNAVAPASLSYPDSPQAMAPSKKGAGFPPARASQRSKAPQH